jgi:hypothetical protein
MPSNASLSSGRAAAVCFSGVFDTGIFTPAVTAGNSRRAQTVGRSTIGQWWAGRVGVVEDRPVLVRAPGPPSAGHTLTP